MDQIKTGKFIAEMRKEKKLTQRELADLLFISDKTVSKWETGKGLPEVALMLPLCNALGITVNELLSAERLADSEYQKRAEENIMNLMKEKEESKRNIRLGAITAIISIISATTLVSVAGLVDLEVWQRILLIFIALIDMAGGIYVAAVLEMKSGTFECRHCKARFIPTASAFVAGPHSITTRYLKCPECGKKSFCKKRLTH
jgi:transcriptional regulator with XRE-family HTH domain/DNA-directed RNA polymerase subunit RPC12/RpoP